MSQPTAIAASFPHDENTWERPSTNELLALIRSAARNAATCAAEVGQRVNDAEIFRKRLADEFELIELHASHLPGYGLQKYQDIVNRFPDMTAAEKDALRIVLVPAGQR